MSKQPPGMSLPETIERSREQVREARAMIKDLDRAISEGQKRIHKTSEEINETLSRGADEIVRLMCLGALEAMTEEFRIWMKKQEGIVNEFLSQGLQSVEALRELRERYNRMLGMVELMNEATKREDRIIGGP